MKILQPFAALVRLNKSNSARAALIYLTSSGLNMAVPFLLLPIMTRYLEPADYGRAAMFQSVVMISNTITTFALRYPLLLAFSVGPKDERPHYLTSMLTIIAGISAILVAAMAALSGLVENLTGLPTIWTLVAVLAGSGMTVNQFRLTTFQADNRAGSYGLFQNSATLLNMALSVVLIVGLGFDWIGRAAGLTFSIWAMTTVSMVAFYRNGLFGVPKRAMAQEALVLAVAAIPHAISAVLLSYSDRFFLSGTYTMDQVGVYALASQLGLVIMLFGTALNTALTPWAFRKLDSIKSAHEYRNLAAIAGGLVAAITAGTVLYYLAVMLLFHVIIPSRYDEALMYFPWLLAAAYFNALYFVFVSPILLYKKTKILAASGVVNLVFSVSMFFVLSEYFGPIGVAIAMCGARFILFATAFTFGVRLVRQKMAAAAGE